MTRKCWEQSCKGVKGFLLTIRTAKLVKRSQIQLTWSKFPLLLCCVVVLHPRSLQSFTVVIANVIIVKNKQVPNTLRSWRGHVVISVRHSWEEKEIPNLTTYKGSSYIYITRNPSFLGEAIYQHVNHSMVEIQVSTKFIVTYRFSLRIHTL
jgi:hypothetical protein